MAEKPGDQRHWAEVAPEWIAWARAPNHDAFWAYRKAFNDFVGAGSDNALEVGCGEGRVSRELKALGHAVTASDAVAQLVKAAKEMDSAHHYVVSQITRLPFPNSSFDLIVAYNVLMDVEDVPNAIAEVRRVMRPTGRLIISIVHPLADRGRFTGTGGDAIFEIKDSYFGRHRFQTTDQHNGLIMRFAGWSQPLQDYAFALECAGLAITGIKEPIPATDAEYARFSSWTRIPLFLWITARPYA